MKEDIGAGVGDVGEQADDGSGGLKLDGLVAAKNDWRVVASVYVGEDAGVGVVLGVEEGGVTVGGRGLVDEAVDVAHQRGEIAGLQQRCATQAGAEAGHEEGGGDAFAGDVAESEGEARRRRAAGTAGEKEEVVVVAADGLGGAAEAGEIDALEMGVDLREEALLDLAGDLNFAGDALAVSDLGGEVFEELGVFEREAGLGGDGLEELAVGAGVGLFGSLGAERDDAGETVAAGERDEKLGGEIVERGALGVGGVDEPAGGVVAIDVGGSPAASERGDSG